ncbi:MAG: VCBS repeat-containing protein, partial [candidate division KSB1 bacterium]|nr:VCBS repeat-containing protein [candidate division KSB1 bacterium]
MKKSIAFVLFLFLFCIFIHASYGQIDHIRFAAPLLYGVEPAPGHIAGADFNGDGSCDFVVASILEGGGDLLISDGNGGYARSSNRQDGEATMSITLDFNNDGWEDYAIVTNKGVRVVKNHMGIGWSVKTYFQYYQGFITTVTGPISFCAADFDADGFTEIAVAIVEPDTKEQVLKCIENNAGVLAEDTTAYALTDGPSYEHLRSIATGDFNSDGWPDVAVSFTDAKKLSLLLNDGSGGFAAPFMTDLDVQAWMIVAEDFDHDGMSDIAVGSQTDKAIKVLLSKGDASFTALDNLALGDALYSLGTADLDGDGDADLYANSADNLFTSW